MFDDDAVLNIFVPSQDTPVFTATKKEQRKKNTRASREYLAKQGIQTRHYQTNTILTQISDNNIKGRTMFQVIHQKRGELEPKVTVTGIYEDEFRRTSSGWKFSSRNIRLDHEFR